jgi:hypothetical protein
MRHSILPMIILADWTPLGVAVIEHFPSCPTKLQVNIVVFALEKPQTTKCGSLP